MWLLYALLSAFFLATADALSKRLLASADERIVTWVRFLFATPYLIILLWFIKIPELGFDFWRTVIILIPIELVAVVLYIRAIKVSPLSLSVPFLSWTPVFLILIGWLVLGERVGPAGIAGILAVVVGAYLLYVGRNQGGWTAPFQAIAREPGARLMLVVAFLYAVTSSLGKVAILQSSPTAFAVVYTVVLAVAFAPIAMIRSRPNLVQMKTHLGAFFLIGLLWALMILFHTLALVEAEVAYMIAVKRTSLLFSVLYGTLLFREENLAGRLAGSLVMLAGVVLISTQ